MEKHMRKIGMIMNVLMGVSLSCALSLTGLLASGHFALPAWLVSFGLSTLLSLAIGFCLPVRRAALALCARCRLRHGSPGALALESLVSDVFYTPLITLLMVALAHHGAAAGIRAAAAAAPSEEAAAAILAQVPPFAPMFLHSLALSMAVGYVLIFVLQPFFLRLLLGRPQQRAAAPATDVC